MLNFEWKEFEKNLKKLITFYSRFSVLPINADQFEELVYTTLKHMGKNPEWKPGSHKPGADITIKAFAISSKSGQVANNMLTISSYRLTRFPTLQEKLNFLKNDTREHAIYLCCARTDTKDERIYRIFVIPATLFHAFTDTEWEEVKTKKGEVAGWKTCDSQGIKAEINKKMSDQLWIHFPLELCTELFQVNLQKNELGIDADLPLREEQK